MRLAAYTLTISVIYALTALVNDAVAQVLVVPFVALLLVPILVQTRRAR